MEAIAHHTAPMMAQESTGKISGTVSNPAGAIVPHAGVTVSNSETGLKRTTKTNASGLFFVSNLPIGNYTLSIEASGFKKFVASNIRVNVNDRLDIPVRMEIGGMTETVSVTETAGADPQPRVRQMARLRTLPPGHLEGNFSPDP